MIWLSLRQFRAQAATLFGCAALLAVALAATGPHLARMYHADRASFLSELTGVDTGLYLVGTLAVMAVPVLAGMFCGAPLVARELDAGTHRLAWTLVSRTRWLTVKLVVAGGAAVLTAGLLSLVVTWWAGPIDTAIANRDGQPGPGIFVLPRLAPEVFAGRGVVPFGYAAFAFTLGVLIGVLVRRTLPAMAILLAAFIATQVVMTVTVRPHLITPVTADVPITAADLTFIGTSGNVTVSIPQPGAWVFAQHTIGESGLPAALPSWGTQCPGSSPGQPDQACYARLAGLGYRQRATYQPESRFWPIQAEETGIYLALTLALAGVCAWRLGRLS